MKNREEIATKYQWDITHLYETEELWRKDFDKLKELLNEVTKFKGKLNNKEVLLEFYEYSKKQDILMDKVIIYVYLHHLLDVEADKYNKLLREVENLADDFAIKSSYILPELNSYDVAYLESLLEDERFRLHYMDINNLIKHKPHILSHEVEEVVSKVSSFSGAFSDIYDAFDCVDVEFRDVLDSEGKSHKVTSSNYIRIMENRDRVLRKNAYESFFDAYKAICNTIANNYIGNVKKDWFYANVYKYDSVLQSNLENNDLSEKLYYTLINNVNKMLPLKHRWSKIKKDYFKLDKMYPYDLSVPLSKSDRVFGYEEACNIVKKALGVLGQDYVDAVSEAIDNNWIDVYPTKNKDTGGCNISLYGEHSYILLNYEGTFNDVSTIAHELGHAMHHYFSEKNQPYEHTSVNIFLAEIASTSNEVLLKKYMYNNSKDVDEKIFILQEYIGLISSTLFGQSMFSEFEDYAHKIVEKQEPITKDMLLDKYAELQEKYSGSAVEKTDNSKYGWMVVPHFYRAYYVYSYATGITCAINFAKRCLEGEDGVKDLKRFISSGMNDYPLNILRSCGIDLETDEPYKLVAEELEWALDEITKLLSL